MNAVNNSLRALKIYRQFFSVTSSCTDRPLKLYIRRRIRQQYRKNIQVSTNQVPQLLNAAEQQLKVVTRQINLRKLYQE